MVHVGAAPGRAVQKPSGRRTTSIVRNEPGLNQSGRQTVLCRLHSDGKRPRHGEARVVEHQVEVLGRIVSMVDPGRRVSGIGQRLVSRGRIRPVCRPSIDSHRSNQRTPRSGMSVTRAGDRQRRRRWHPRSIGRSWPRLARPADERTHHTLGRA